VKTYFIGADVDSKMTEIAFEQGGQIVRRRRVATSIVALRQELAEVSGRKVLTFEEGPMADWLVRHLVDAVDEIVVCDPRRNRLISEDGDKDDPIDAGKLAELLRGNFLRAVHHGDSAERVELKQWVGLYHDRVREAVRQANKIRALGRRYLVAIPGRVLRRAKLRSAWLAELKLPALADQLEMLWLGFDAVAKQVHLARAQVVQRTKDLPIVSAWQELPGVGPIRAITFYAYVDTPWRFRSPKAICKYCGVGLLRATSGTNRKGQPNVGQVKMPWACNRRLKDVAMGMAISALGQKANRFAEGYQRQVRQGVTPANARHNVARKMVTVLWAMCKKDRRLTSG
jgi:transposase